MLGSSDGLASSLPVGVFGKTSSREKNYFSNEGKSNLSTQPNIGKIK